MADKMAQFYPDSVRPILVDAPRIQQCEIHGTEELTILHSSPVADLLAAPPRKLFNVAWVIGAGLGLGFSAALAALLLGQVLAGWLR